MKFKGNPEYSLQRGPTGKRRYHAKPAFWRPPPLERPRFFQRTVALRADLKVDGIHFTGELEVDLSGSEDEIPREVTTGAPISGSTVLSDSDFRDPSGFLRFGVKAIGAVHQLAQLAVSLAHAHGVLQVLIGVGHALMGWLAPMAGGKLLLLLLPLIL